MQIDYVLIADYAEIVAGKLYLMGGGWDVFRAQAVPVPVRMAVALGVRVGWEETNQPRPVQVVVDHEDGAELARIDGAVNVGRPAHLVPGSSQLTQMAANLSLNLSQFGGYRVRASGGPDKEVSLILPFRLVKV